MLTANWYVHSLAVRIENGDVDIGSQVATIQMGNKIGVPVKVSAINEDIGPVSMFHQHMDTEFTR